jgi:hypothetical protein
MHAPCLHVTMHGCCCVRVSVMRGLPFITVNCMRAHGIRTNPSRKRTHSICLRLLPGGLVQRPLTSLQGVPAPQQVSTNGGPITCSCTWCTNVTMKVARSSSSSRRRGAPPDGHYWHHLPTQQLGRSVMAGVQGSTALSLSKYTPTRANARFYVHFFVVCSLQVIRV